MSAGRLWCDVVRVWEREGCRHKRSIIEAGVVQEGGQARDHIKHNTAVHDFSQPFHTVRTHRGAWARGGDPARSEPWPAGAGNRSRHRLRSARPKTCACVSRMGMTNKRRLPRRSSQYDLSTIHMECQQATNHHLTGSPASSCPQPCDAGSQAQSRRCCGARARGACAQSAAGLFLSLLPLGGCGIGTPRAALPPPAGWVGVGMVSG